MAGAGVPVNEVFALKDMPAIGVPIGTPEEVTVGAIVIGAGGGVGATGAGAGAGGGVGAGATYAAAIEIAKVKFAVMPLAPATVIVIVEVRQIEHKPARHREPKNQRHQQTTGEQLWPVMVVRAIGAESVGQRKAKHQKRQ